MAYFCLSLYLSIVPRQVKWTAAVIQSPGYRVMNRVIDAWFFIHFVMKCWIFLSCWWRMIKCKMKDYWPYQHNCEFIDESGLVSPKNVRNGLLTPTNDGSWRNHSSKQTNQTLRCSIAVLWGLLTPKWKDITLTCHPLSTIKLGC